MSGRYSAIEGPWLVIRDPQDGEPARVVGEAAACETAYKAAALLEEDDSRQPQLEGYYLRGRCEA